MSRPVCGRDLPNAASSQGRVPEFKLGIIGPRAAGKTSFLVGALWHLETRFAPLHKMTLSFPDPVQEAAYREQVRYLSSGNALQATHHEQFPPQIVVRLQEEAGWCCLLSLVDAAGEDFTSELALNDHPLEDYDGLIVLVDPFAEPSVREGELGPLSPEIFQQTVPSDVSPFTVLSRVLGALEHRLGVLPGQRIGLMVAVVVTKVDVSPVAERCPRLDRRPHQFHCIAAAALHAERHNEAIQNLLRQMGLSNMVNQLRQRFDVVGFFAASPLGRPAFPPKAAPFEPRGVLEPVVSAGLPPAGAGRRLFLLFLRDQYLFVLQEQSARPEGVGERWRGLGLRRRAGRRAAAAARCVTDAAWPILRRGHSPGDRRLRCLGLGADLCVAR